ncbi:diguanylate cyclase [Kamptonema cortianum]|nr:diguanylate cyclase [Geitlerinema splendidum]MDK3162142.1 diguanylate cyclase [Kamptonema cortianum]
MRPIKDISLNTAQVSPDATVVDAIQTMDVATVDAVAIVDGTEFLGMITQEAAILADTTDAVRDHMRGVSVYLDGSTMTRSAAKALVNAKSDYAVVTLGGKFIGLLTPLALVADLGQSWDPLTGLSWSDRLRDWGVDKLENGREISVIFFDLDNFGDYNKRFGHIVGDAVLKAVATKIQSAADDKLDIVVRYGGDEFAVGTLRNQTEATAWARKLTEEEVFVSGVGEPVKFSCGVAGGKREKAPSREHVTATLDNLINLASQHCTENKRTDLPQLAAVTPRESGRVSIVDHLNQTVRVEIKQKDAWIAGESSFGVAVWKAVAQATAQAVSQSRGTEPVKIDDTFFVASDSGHEVIVTGVTSNDEQFRVTRALGRNAEESIVEAVLAAEQSIQDA